MLSDQQNPMRPAFEVWAKDHLPQRCGFDLEEGDYLDSVTRVAFIAYRAGRKDGGDAAPDALSERGRCAKVCFEYSKHLIATGEPGTPSEWMAHGAEACFQLLCGRNEYGDPPESEHFAPSYAASLVEKSTKTA